MEKNLNKKINIPAIIFGVWFFLTLSGFFIFNTLDTLKVKFDEKEAMASGIIYFILFFVLLFISKKLFDIYMERKKEITLIVLYLLIFSSLAILLQGIFGIIGFDQQNFHYFWTDASFIFGSAAVIYLAFFNMEVFKKGINAGNNRKYLIFLFMMMMIGNVFNSRKMIWGVEDAGILLALIILFVATIAEFIKLTKEAQKLSKRIDTPVEKKSFKLISLSGVFIISAYVAFIIYRLIIELAFFRFFTTVAFFIGYSLLYKGFVMPMKKD